MKNTLVYCDAARRKTVSALDVVYALKSINKNLYTGTDFNKVSIRKMKPISKINQKAMTLKKKTANNTQISRKNHVSSNIVSSSR